MINGRKVIQFNNKNIFPEYYLIRVEKYQNIVKRKIDEWIYLIKNNEIKEGSTAKNIDKAEQKLAYLNMSEAERKVYERYLVNLHREKDILDTAKEEGLKEGREEGREEGLKEGLKEGEHQKAIETAGQMKKDGMSTLLIIKYTGLTAGEVEAIN